MIATLATVRGITASTTVYAPRCASRLMLTVSDNNGIPTVEFPMGSHVIVAEFDTMENAFRFALNMDDSE